MSPARSRTRHGLAWLGIIFLSLLPPTHPTVAQKGRVLPAHAPQLTYRRQIVSNTYPRRPTCRACERHTGSGGLPRGKSISSALSTPRKGGLVSGRMGAGCPSCAAPVFEPRWGCAAPTRYSIPRVLVGHAVALWRSAWGGGGLKRCRRRRRRTPLDSQFYWVRLSSAGLFSHVDAPGEMDALRVSSGKRFVMTDLC